MFEETNCTVMKDTDFVLKLIRFEDITENHPLQASGELFSFKKRKWGLSWTEVRILWPAGPDVNCPLLTMARPRSARWIQLDLHLEKLESPKAVQFTERPRLSQDHRKRALCVPGRVREGAVR